MPAVADYLNPDLPAGLARVVMPVVDATPATLEGYGCLVDDPASCGIEIVRWPAQGSRPVDPDTGDEGGTTEGTFVSANGRATSCTAATMPSADTTSSRTASDPGRADADHRARPAAHAALARELPSGRRPALLPARTEAVPGAARAAGRRRRSPRISSASASTATAASTSIRTSGTRACSRQSGTQRFFDKQGAVHARVSVDFAREFGCLLEAPIE